MTWNAAFIAFLTSPLTLWLINRFLLRNKIHWLLLWPIAVVVCYASLLLGVHLLDAHLLAELYKHDLNGDGSFSGSENSPAMQEAMNRVNNDTARALAPITGIPFSIIWVCMNYVPFGLISLVFWRKRSFRGDFDADTANDFQPIVESSSVDVDASNNPYHPPTKSSGYW